MARTIEDAAREQCLAFPGAEEYQSHGAPNFRVRGSTTFAIYAHNHHGDGRVALWLKAADGAQEHLTALDPEHFFVPPYVGKRGWIGLRLDRALAWEAIRNRIAEAWRQVAQPALLPAGDVQAVAPPDSGLDPTERDPLRSKRALQILEHLRGICLALPETSEALQFGSPVWKAGRRTFASAHAYRGPLMLGFWVGVERQSLMTADPRFHIPAYTGHNGWIALDVQQHADWDEIEALAHDSYRHFALKRMLAQLPD